MDIIGKRAYKKAGHFAGLIGVIEQSKFDLIPHVIAFYNSNGDRTGAVGFHNENDIVIVEDDENCMWRF